jgi:hypothetical protein
VTATDGGVEPRGVLLDSEPRQAQVPRTVDPQWRRQRDQDVKAWKKVCRVTCACEAEARQARATFAPDLPATVLGASPVRATPRDGQRGRPGQGVPPDQRVDHSAGTLAAALAARQARIDQHSGVMLATTARDATPWPPHTLWAGDTGQTQGERGWRFLNNPACLAASRDRKKPARSRARVLVMTVGGLGDAALAYRLRQALQGHDATCPHPCGTRGQHPTARGVWPSVVGLHLRIAPGQWPIVLPLTDAHRHLRQLLGKP